MERQRGREGERGRKRERGEGRESMCVLCALRCVVRTSREATVSTSYM